MGLGTDPQWAWGEILISLGRDLDRPGGRSPMGLGTDP